MLLYVGASFRARWGRVTRGVIGGFRIALGFRIGLNEGNGFIVSG